MGTRALVHFKDEDDKTLVTLYRQFDGYPEGLGQELQTLAKGARIVNGYSSGDAIPMTFNGVGCFAAWAIGKLKENTIGNVYIHKPDDSDCGEEYTYWVRPLGGRLVVTGRAEWADEPKEITIEELLKRHDE